MTKTSGVDKAVTVYQNRGQELVAKFAEREIKSAKDMSEATEVLSRMNQIMDAAEEEKQKVLTPLNAARTAELKRWKPFETFFSPAIESLRGKIGVYQTAETRRAEKEAEALADRIGEGKGKIKVETAVRKMGEIDKPAGKVETAAGSLRFKPTPKLKIVNTVHLINDIIQNHAGNFERFVSYNEKEILIALQAGEKIRGVEIEIIQVPVNSR